VREVGVGSKTQVGNMGSNAHAPGKHVLFVLKSPHCRSYECTPNTVNVS
jgi:hypothetical protein